jgi:hypothetical protein
MRCFFIRDGRIVSVEELLGLTDIEAVQKARSLFAERSEPVDGYEVWDLARMVYSNSANAHSVNRYERETPELG